MANWIRVIDGQSNLRRLWRAEVTGWGKEVSVLRATATLD